MSEIYVPAAEPEGMGDRDISDSTLCPFAAAFPPGVRHGRTFGFKERELDADGTTMDGTAGDTAATDCEVDKDKWVKVEELDKRYQEAREGCTKKLRQEVSMLTGIPFPTGHFQRLEHLVAAIRLMGQKFVVVVVCTENQCSIAGFSSPITMTTRTIHEVKGCNGQAPNTKLYWHAPTSTVEVAALQRGGARQGERTSVIYVDGTCKTPSHYEELQGKLGGTEVSTMIGGKYLTGQYKVGQAMNERELLQKYRLQPVMADEETTSEEAESMHKGAEAERDSEEREDREAFYSGESEGEEVTLTVDQEDLLGKLEEGEEESDDMDHEDTEARTQAWDDMCQKVVALNTKQVRKAAATWGKMDGTTKLVQITVSHLTRREVTEVSKSDLVMVVGEEFWEKEDAPQGQGAPGEETTSEEATSLLKTIRASKGLRPTVTTKLKEAMVIRESQDESEITQQSKQFREKAIMNKAVDGKKPRTYMPVISEKTAREVAHGLQWYDYT